MANYNTASTRLESSYRRTSSAPAAGPVRASRPINDFASFMMVFHDIFLADEFYSDFGLTDDVQTSNIIGEGAQFAVKLLLLRGQLALRTSSAASSRLTEGRAVVLKRPRLRVDEHGAFTEAGPIRTIVNELRVITHPRLRHHPNVLDVYGFAWEREAQVPGVTVWPILMEEYGGLGTLDAFLARVSPHYLDTKLALVGDVAAGVRALHACGICHADLKPENILVCETAEGRPVAKLADFGLSVIMDERISPATWDSGSPLWTVPEWGRECSNDCISSADGKRHEIQRAAAFMTRRTDKRAFGKCTAVVCCSGQRFLTAKNPGS
jgi:serine/threonine protein kinase